MLDTPAHAGAVHNPAMPSAADNKKTTHTARRLRSRGTESCLLYNDSTDRLSHPSDAGSAEATQEILRIVAGASIETGLNRSWSFSIRKTLLLGLV